MELLNKIDDVKAYLAKVKKKYRFRKARLAREDAAEFTYALAECRGKLEVCKKSFLQVITRQSRNICAGEETGADTLIQQQLLWDSAIGYMMVRDAIFALETIGNYESVAHAYELLDCAIRQVSGKKTPLLGWLKRNNNEVRNLYGYVTSDASKSKKEVLLDSFFEHLKHDGDIEKHLFNAMNENKDATRQNECFNVANQGQKDSEIGSRKAILQEMSSVPQMTEEERAQQEEMIKNGNPPKGDF